MKKKDLKKPRMSYIGIIIVGIILGLLLMPIWHIKTVEVMHNSLYKDEEIIKASQIKESNILDFSFNKAKKRLKELAYIQDVSITYEFPGKAVIEVVENEPLIYVEFMGSYLSLNKEGQVLEETRKKGLALPVVKGLVFSEFIKGEVLPIENEDTFICVKEIMKILKNRQYDEKVKTIDVYNLEEIHLYVDNLDVIMGDIGDFDKKLLWLIEIHASYDMGRLDLSSIDETKQATLEPIT